MNANQWFALRVGSGLICFGATMILGKSHPASMALAFTYLAAVLVSILWEHFGW